MPVLITGSAEPLSVAMLRAVRRELLKSCGRGRLPSVIDRIASQTEQSSSQPLDNQVVVELVEEVADHVVSTRKASGLLILLDELGKFLEYAALHPDRQDVFLLQSLAEAASRSGHRPFIVVGLLHQGFNAYSEHLSPLAQKEWEKIAGRFDELLFNHPLEHVTRLIADALNIRSRSLPYGIVSRMREDMATLLDLGWFGASYTRQLLVDIAPKLYPIHPSVIPALLQLFTCFGQNERSLFSFLLSAEPFGLLEFARRPLGADQFYRLYNLYDYARHSFGYRLAQQSFHSHWNHIESMVESFPVENNEELQILKAVGLINMLDSGSLVPCEDMLTIAVPGSRAQVKTTVRKLKFKKILWYRGVAGGYCLWPHTSVNLDRAYRDAGRALGQAPDRVAAHITDYLEIGAIVARRHYIETGNLRHFQVQFSTVDQLPSQIQGSDDTADGKIIIPLCETEDERKVALRFAQSDEVRSRPGLLCAVTSPLTALARLVLEVQRWEWVLANTPELNNDTFASEEVSRQIAVARDALQQRVKCFIGIQEFSGGSELTWFCKGELLPIRSGRDLLVYLSRVCDEIYSKAPQVANELVNRRTLSSAAAAARMRLIERVFTSANEHLLGMDAKKKPPEMSIYLSILKNSGIHKESNGGWVLRVPDEADDSCHVRPALNCIQRIFENAGLGRVRVSEILAELRKPPFGVRDGLAPILLAVFAAMHDQHLAFYDKGAFMREAGILDLMRLTKLPETFEMQYCKMGSSRRELFERLLKTTEANVLKGRRADILDVVRPLCVFAAHLPPFTQKTKTISQNAIGVRDALLSAREPALLLFRDLPAACGFPEVNNEGGARKRDLDSFVAILKRSLDELRQAYPALQERMKASLVAALQLGDSTRDFRAGLARRSRHVSLFVKEPQLKAFCNRLSDTELSEPEWLESIGSLVCSLPPARWSDIDAERFVQELGLLSARFRRVESVAFGAQGGTQSESAMRVAITRLDGSEVERVVYVPNEEKRRVMEFEKEVLARLGSAPNPALAGTLTALWKVLCEDGTK